MHLKIFEQEAGRTTGEQQVVAHIKPDDFRRLGLSENRALCWNLSVSEILLFSSYSEKHEKKTNKETKTEEKQRSWSWDHADTHCEAPSARFSQCWSGSWCQGWNCPAGSEKERKGFAIYKAQTFSDLNSKKVAIKQCWRWRKCTCRLWDDCPTPFSLSEWFLSRISNQFRDGLGAGFLAYVFIFWHNASLQMHRFLGIKIRSQGYGNFLKQGRMHHSSFWLKPLWIKDWHMHCTTNENQWSFNHR